MSMSAEQQELTDGSTQRREFPLDPTRAMVMTSGIEAVRGLVLRLDEESLKGLLEGQDSPYEVLLHLLEQGGALDVMPTEDPLAAARIRGARARKQLAEAEGGSVSSVEMGELLGITRQAVDERRKTGKLLALELGRRGYLYPKWQVSVDGQPLKGLEDVLAALHEHDVWGKMIFFLTEDPRLEGKRPLDALRTGQIERVLNLARTYGEHGSL